MTTTIWKFEIREPADDLAFNMPEGAEVLYVAVQKRTPCIWARVDPEAPKTMRRFRLYGTGHSISDETGHYVGSFQVYGGELVFHLFEAP